MKILLNNCKILVYLGKWLPNKISLHVISFLPIRFAFLVGFIYSFVFILLYFNILKKFENNLLWKQENDKILEL